MGSVPIASGWASHGGLNLLEGLVVGRPPILPSRSGRGRIRRHQ